VKRFRSLQARNPLPNGAISIGVGLGVAGVCIYALLAIASHSLNSDEYSAFALFYGLLFVVAPGIFLPLEQELGRALAARRSRGDGGAPVIERVGIIGGGFLVFLLVVCGILWGPIDTWLFNGNRGLLIALLHARNSLLHAPLRRQLPSQRNGQRSALRHRQRPKNSSNKNNRKRRPRKKRRTRRSRQRAKHFRKVRGGTREAGRAWLGGQCLALFLYVFRWFSSTAREGTA